MKNIVTLIKSKKGEAYIDVVVTVICIMMVLVFAINTFMFLSIKQDMDYITKELLLTAATDGQISSNISTRRNELYEETGINPAYITWETNYFNVSEGTVQLGEKIEIVLTYETKFKGFGLFSIPITLTTKHSSLSQRYWKE